MFWTGIGSRQVPDDVIANMVKFGYEMASTGMCLRSGKASGSDTGFQIGVETFLLKKGNENLPLMEIYIPWNRFDNYRVKIVTHDIIGPDQASWPQAKQIAKQIHPNPKALKDAALSLHARNVYQVLGTHLTEPSEFVIFYADEHNGVVKGGTATAVHLARKHNIPTYNIKTDNGDEELKRIWHEVISRG